MNLENLKELVASDDYRVYFGTRAEEIEVIYECDDGKIALTIYDASSGEEHIETVLPETLESHLIIYKELDLDKVADLIGGN